MPDHTGQPTQWLRGAWGKSTALGGFRPWSSDGHRPDPSAGKDQAGELKLQLEGDHPPAAKLAHPPQQCLDVRLAPHGLGSEHFDALGKPASARGRSSIARCAGNEERVAEGLDALSAR